MSILAKQNQFNFLLLGVGNLFWVPIAIKYGKRPTLIISMVLLFAILVWTAMEPSFTGLLAARCLSGFVSAAGEVCLSYPDRTGLIHHLEYCTRCRIGYLLSARACCDDVSVGGPSSFGESLANTDKRYTLLIASATAIGPLLASFITQYSPGSWRDYVWVCAALAGANALAIYLVYPESNYQREEVTPNHISLLTERYTEHSSESGDMVRMNTNSWHYVKVVKKPWAKIWSSFIIVDHNVNLLVAFWRPVQMLLRPAVLFAIFVYGTHLAAQIILMYVEANSCGCLARVPLTQT